MEFLDPIITQSRTGLKQCVSHPDYTPEENEPSSLGGALHSI